MACSTHESRQRLLQPLQTANDKPTTHVNIIVIVSLLTGLLVIGSQSQVMDFGAVAQVHTLKENQSVNEKQLVHFANKQPLKNSFIHVHHFTNECALL